MPNVTTRFGLQIPLGPEPVANLRDFIESGYLAIDDLAAIADQGTFSNRPTSSPGSPGIVGRFYFVIGVGENAGILYYDYGTGWVAVNSAVVDGPADQGTLRTLGAGALQAAAGNDSRLSNQRTPTDGSVTLGKLAAALKPSTGAGNGDEAVRAIGMGSGQVAAGNDSRFTKVHRHIHPFTISEDTAWAGAANKEVGRFTVRFASPETATLVFCEHSLGVGASTTFKLQRYTAGAWADITGYTALAPTTAPAQTDAADVALVSGDKVRLICTAVGTGKGGEVGVAIDYAL